MKKVKQPWIYSKWIDGTFILAPALTISAIILLLRSKIEAVETLPVWLWGVLVIGVDVAHVYSTIFRTYADPKEFQARKTLYTLTPLICWAVGTLLYSIDALVFWRAITYFAVFHFIRQQYGFMMIYSRNEKRGKIARQLDELAIYMATLYPLIYWHTHLPRHFDWFIESDFMAVNLPWLDGAAFALYIAVLLLYFVKEIWQSIKTSSLNIPKNLLLIGTIISWWVAIIAFDNDIAFTASNVIAHGVPYIALIWIYGRNQGKIEPSRKLLGNITMQKFFTLRFLPIFVGILLMLAYLEEGLWDGFIWTEHKVMFAPFHILPVLDDKTTLSWIVPLLALPQLTHYALDAFIWRMRIEKTDWKQVLFYQTTSNNEQKL